MSAEEALITNSAYAVEQFSVRSQITLGGEPRRRLLFRKSESLETIVRPFCLAYSQISRSVAVFSPQSRTCREPGYASLSKSTRREERFWSTSSFTRGSRESYDRCPRRTRDRQGCLPW